MKTNFAVSFVVNFICPQIRNFQFPLALYTNKKPFFNMIECMKPISNLKWNLFLPAFNALSYLYKGSFNNYVDEMRGGGGQKMYVFVHAQGIKTVHEGRGGAVKKWQILSTYLLNAP